MKNYQLILFLFLAFEAWAIKPEKKYVLTPASFDIPFNEFRITTPDGYEIFGWDYSTTRSNASTTVILVGTDAGNISFLIWQAKALRAQGLRVIAFDYRGFGKSGDFNIRTDYLFHHEFATDLDTVIRYIRQSYPKDRLGLYGMSMGTYISLLRKEKVEFLIADGFYCDPFAVTHRLKEVKNDVVLLPEGSEKISNFSPAAPALIITMSKDKITPPEDAKAFQKNNHVSILELDGEHLQGFNILTRDEPGDLYAEKVAFFLRASGLL